MSFRPLPFLLLLPLVLHAAAPLNYIGHEAVTTAPDGGLRPAVGVENIQVVRANRTAPLHADHLADTYLHAPMLCYWQGNFYLEYLSGARNEHDAPTVTSLMRSSDGRNWEAPRIIFPSFLLPDGSATIAHQRMGFYVAPDGRLLVLSFYGKHPAPNDGTGIGRAVREVNVDGSLGSIYFIRLNARQPFADFTPPYPLYTTSSDQGFIAACQALLANKLMTAQWWEEDQLDESGFNRVRGKALSYVTRPDGSTLGIWKNRLVATTINKGETWTKTEFAGNLPNNASKYWLQSTADHRYALVFNPTNRSRYPLAVATSQNGTEFNELLAIHGELPDQRFPGGYKNPGPQYVRGIVEGNGTPPDAASAFWLTYSVNKEDIWVARVPVPVTAVAAAGPVNDDFNTAPVGAPPAGWNTYSPLWAPVRIVETGDGAGRALELRDEDPYDYARAIRVFPETHGLITSFKVLARQRTARLEIDLLDAHGARPVQLAFAEDGHLWARHEGIWNDAGPYTANRWITVSLEISKNPASDTATLLVDGEPVLFRPAVFTDPAKTVERISFRTGAYRERGMAGQELSGADTKVSAAIFLIDDVMITPVADAVN